MFLDTGMLDVRAGWDDVMTLHIDPVHSISEDQTPAQTYYGQEPDQRGEQETSGATPATVRSVSRTQQSFHIKEGERVYRDEISFYLVRKRDGHDVSD